MKKLLAIVAFLLIGAVSYAQWNVSGNDIYNTNTGNVGIGTSTPASKLNVFDAANTASLRIESPYTGTGTPVYNVATMNLVNTATGDLVYMGLRKRAGAHDMVQSVYDATAGAWREFIYFNFGTRKYEMRGGIGDAEFKNTGNILFNNTGAVGIGMGTSAFPANVALAVAGKVVCKEVEVTLTGLPDYVFNCDYNLKSLYEVESFINENKHLPEVPSEKEVLENGLNLGDMNSILLKKVEELTLYVIQLKKENDQLKERVDVLAK